MDRKPLSPKWRKEQTKKVKPAKPVKAKERIASLANDRGMMTSHANPRGKK